MLHRGDAKSAKQRLEMHETSSFTRDKPNKAGYTANTSRGRVGRGGNACFPTFRLERDGPTNQPTNQPTNGRTDGQSLL